MSTPGAGPVYTGGGSPPSRLSSDNCAPDTLDLEFFGYETNGALGDKQIILTRPARRISLVYAHGAITLGGVGSNSVYLHFQPLNLVSGGVLIFPFGSIPPMIDLGISLTVEFTKPITRFFLTTRDFGAVEGLGFLATNDIEIWIPSSHP